VTATPAASRPSSSRSSRGWPWGARAARRRTSTAKRSAWPVSVAGRHPATGRCGDRRRARSRAGGARARWSGGLPRPIRAGLSPRGGGSQRDLAGRPHPARRDDPRPSGAAGAAVADSDPGRLQSRGRRLRRQPRSALGPADRAGAAAGDLAQARSGVDCLWAARGALQRPRLGLQEPPSRAGRCRPTHPADQLHRRRPAGPRQDRTPLRGRSRPSCCPSCPATCRRPAWARRAHRDSRSPNSRPRSATGSRPTTTRDRTQRPGSRRCNAGRPEAGCPGCRSPSSSSTCCCWPSPSPHRPPRPAAVRMSCCRPSSCSPVETLA
jgi:hypothetical protein